MVFSILISVYNQLENLKIILEAIEKQSVKDYELILVDDGSSDGTKEWVTENRPDIKYFWQEDKGFRLAKARNMALNSLNGEYTLCIEGDIIPSHTLISSYIPHLAPNKFLLGIRHDIPHRPEKLDYKWLEENIIAEDWRLKFIRKGESCSGGKLVSGCNVVIPTAKLKEIGGWDEGMEGWGTDDNDLGYRLDMAGCQAEFVFDSVGYHIYHEKREISLDNQARFSDKVRRSENYLNIFAYPVAGSRQYRLDQIGKYISRNTRNLMKTIDGGIQYQDIVFTDVIVCEQTVARDKIDLVREYTNKFNKVMVAEIDDYYIANKDNPHLKEHNRVNAVENIEYLVKNADIVTTTTPCLADKLSKLNPKVHILPNYLDLEKWDWPKLKNEYQDEIRIGWAGSSSHRADMEWFAPIIKKVLSKYTKARFFYCGDDKLRKIFDGIERAEYVIGTQIHDWPIKLHSFRWDLAVAPLLDNEFNKCKSNLKYLEYSVCQYPAVYSDIVYKDTVKHGKTGFIAKTEDDWIYYISKLIENKYWRDKLSSAAYLDVINNYDIDKHWDKWLKVYREAFNEKQAKVLAFNC